MYSIKCKGIVVLFLYTRDRWCQRNGDELRKIVISPVATYETVHKTILPHSFMEDVFLQKTLTPKSALDHHPLRPTILLETTGHNLVQAHGPETVLQHCPGRLCGEPPAPRLGQVEVPQMTHSLSHNCEAYAAEKGLIFPCDDRKKVPNTVVRMGLTDSVPESAAGLSASGGTKLRQIAHGLRGRE